MHTSRESNIEFRDDCSGPSKAIWRATLIGIVALGIVGYSGITASQAQNTDLSQRIVDQARNRIERLDAEGRTRQTGDPILTKQGARRELPPKGGPTVLLKSISFEPESAFLSDEELEAIRANYLGKRVDFSQISNLVRDVNDLYAEKGIVTAAAILPPQDLPGGELKVHLVEGQLGNVAVVGEHQTKETYIFNRIRLAKGTTVDVPTAGKDINFYNKTNRAQLRLLLRPGAAFGFTDLLFGITEPSKHQLQVFFDNEGVSSTGEYQASLYYRRYGILGVDDTFTLYGSEAEGSYSGSVNYEIPITRFGTRLNLGYTRSEIEVVNGPTQILDIRGDSESYTVGLTQAIFVDDKFTVLATGSAYWGENFSSSAGTPLVNSETTKYAPGISVSFLNDNFSFSTQAQLVYADVDNLLAGTMRDIKVGTGSFSGIYRYPEHQIALTANGAWQYTNEQLLPGNLLFQIGGPATVRGYPSDGIAGDSGYYMNFEFHKAGLGKNENIGLFAFTDYGQVFSTFPGHQTLASVGVGLSVAFNDKLNLEVTAARPVLETLSNQSDFEIYGTLTWSIY